MPGALVPIVEGLSDVKAAPILLRKVREHAGRYDVAIATPIRMNRTQIVRSGGLERAIHLALRDRAGAAAILVLLDADDDCAGKLGPQLLQRCRAVSSLPAAVTLAVREYESWLLAGKDSLRGVRGIRGDAEPPSGVENIRDAKRRLTANMTGGRPYNNVDDMAALTKQLDLDRARQRSRSLDRFIREVERLLDAIPKT